MFLTRFCSSNAQRMLPSSFLWLDDKFAKNFVYIIEILKN